MSKERCLMRDVVVNHHEDFISRPQLIDYGLKHPGIFNVERLVEEAVAHASDGKLEFIDGAHMDYPDGSDCKTASIRANPKAPNSVVHRGEISGVCNAAGNMKGGALRCVIYNPIEDETLYYFLPKDFWLPRVTFHPTSGVGKLVYTYNRKRGLITLFEDYRVGSFVELARVSD